MLIWLYTLTSTLIVSLISLVGALTLFAKKKIIKRISIFLVSFAAGALFGDAFIHLLPEAFEKLETNLPVSLLTILGLLTFFALEKFLYWRHCHIPASQTHVHPLGTINLIGDAVHNFIDGLLIGASYLVSFPLGVTTTLAIVLHEIPQEMGDFGVLIYSGVSIKKALVLNFLSAMIATFGAVISLLIGPNVQDYAASLLPITAGGFIYIAGSDLIPELKHESRATSSLGQFLAIVLGITIMALLTILE